MCLRKLSGGGGGGGGGKNIQEKRDLYPRS